MITATDSEHLSEIRSQTIAILREAVGETKDVALIDAPNQRNVGDSLIWAGELAYLQQLGYRIRYVCDLRSYSATDLRKHLPSGGVVLLHGGGNFGDLWPWHQRLRERVVSDLPDYRIVQLSQSIFFSDDALAVQADDVLGRHPDFIALIRDQLSLERASAMLPSVRVRFCPDMAFGYSPTSPTARTERVRRLLIIARADKESASGLNGVSSDWVQPHEVVVTDWGLYARDGARWRLARLIASLNHKATAVRQRWGIPAPRVPNRVLSAALHAINDRNVSSASSLYAGFDVVVVDRLHAHVLAVLLGMKHVLLDNNYRKLGAVFDDYSGRFSTAVYMTDLAAAQVAARTALED